MSLRRLPHVLAFAGAVAFTAACGGSDSARSDAARTNAAANAPGTTPTTVQTSNGMTDTAISPQHHSKAKGALLGAVAGGLIAGKRGAMAGAAAGAEMQHHRNKVQQQQTRP